MARPSWRPCCSYSAYARLAICGVTSTGFLATALRTRHLIIATFTASLTARHETIAYAKIASVCHQGNGMSPGRPTDVRTVPVTASAARADRKVLLGSVAQNQRRSRADTTENTAK